MVKKYGFIFACLIWVLGNGAIAYDLGSHEEILWYIIFLIYLCGAIFVYIVAFDKTGTQNIPLIVVFLIQLFGTIGLYQLHYQYTWEWQEALIYASVLATTISSMYIIKYPRKEIHMGEIK